MAEFRMWKTVKWRQDVYFGELTPTEALLYLYLYLNEDIEYYGVLRYNLAKIADDVNLGEEKVKTILKKFRKDGKIILQEWCLFVKGFMTMQGPVNQKTKNKIRVDAYKLPPKIQAAIEKEISEMRDTTVKEPKIKPEVKATKSKPSGRVGIVPKTQATVRKRFFMPEDDTEEVSEVKSKDRAVRARNIPAFDEDEMDDTTVEEPETTSEDEQESETKIPNYLNLPKIIRDEWWDTFNEKLDMDDNKVCGNVEEAVKMIREHGKEWELELLDLSSVAVELVHCIENWGTWTDKKNFKPSSGHLCSKAVWGLMKNWLTEKGLLR